MHKNIIRPPKITEKSGVCRTMMYEKGNPNSKYHDPTWPRLIRLGSRSVGMVESELDAWISSRPAARGSRSAGGGS